MHVYDIRGIRVEFPYEAYECQRVYMERVIHALQNKEHALLESPTGTGKTLCLLCATLAFIKHHRGLCTIKKESENERVVVKINDDGGNDGKLTQLYVSGMSDEIKKDTSRSAFTERNKMRVVYASRTHSQLSQVVGELKNTNYKPKIALLGSRSQLCVHPHVSTLPNFLKDVKCRKMGMSCQYRQRNESFRKDFPSLAQKVMDIEELGNLGRESQVCPYYLSHQNLEEADIVFVPYNYLVDRKIRSAIRVPLDGNIVVIDEAHNIESVCSESASVDLTAKDLGSAIGEVQKCIDMTMQDDFDDTAYDSELSEDNLRKLKTIFLTLEQVIAGLDLSEEDGYTKPGVHVFDILQKSMLTFETFSLCAGMIEKTIGMYTSNDAVLRDILGEAKSTCALKRFYDALLSIFGSNGEESARLRARSYYVHVHVEAPKKYKGNIANLTASGRYRTLSYWCFDPSVALRQVVVAQRPHSLVLTSGTLSPMDSFATELGVKFPIQLENPHVVSAKQVWVGVVPQGPSGVTLSSAYKTRNLVSYKNDLGNLLCNLARIVPDGVLVFFPSYSVLTSCLSTWKSRTTDGRESVYERILLHKRVVVEPRSSSEVNEAFREFQDAIVNSTGSMFFAVCRGKVSEGLDFADRNGRAVVITGLPYPNYRAPRVRLKRMYLNDAVENRSSTLSGNEWYSQQAIRAINQAIGRIIRHKGDYGAIVLCDNRFTTSRVRERLSMWLRPRTKVYDQFGHAVQSLAKFFNYARSQGWEARALAKSSVLPGGGGGSGGGGDGMGHNDTSVPPTTSGAHDYESIIGGQNESNNEVMIHVRGPKRYVYRGSRRDTRLDTIMDEAPRPPPPPPKSRGASASVTLSSRLKLARDRRVESEKLMERGAPGFEQVDASHVDEYAVPISERLKRQREEQTSSSRVPPTTIANVPTKSITLMSDSDCPATKKAKRKKDKAQRTREFVIRVRRTLNEEPYKLFKTLLSEMAAFRKSPESHFDKFRDFVSRLRVVFTDLPGVAKQFEMFVPERYRALYLKEMGLQPAQLLSQMKLVFSDREWQRFMEILRACKNCVTDTDRKRELTEFCQFFTSGARERTLLRQQIEALVPRHCVRLYLEVLAEHPMITTPPNVSVPPPIRRTTGSVAGVAVGTPNSVKKHKIPIDLAMGTPKFRKRNPKMTHVRTTPSPPPTSQ